MRIFYSGNVKALAKRSERRSRIMPPHPLEALTTSRHLSVVEVGLQTLVAVISFRVVAKTNTTVVRLAGGTCIAAWSVAACWWPCLRLSRILSDWRWKRLTVERLRRRFGVSEKHARLDAMWHAKYGHLPPPAFDAPTASARRFRLDDSSSWLAHLETQGYVVIREVATSDQVKHARDLLWSFVERNTTMRRGEPATWTDAAFQKIGHVGTGICAGCYAGHSALCWYVRCLPPVKRAFELIWSTDQLLVSFDAMNIFRPPGSGETADAIRTLSNWWHVDQGRLKRGRHAIQGFVSLTDATTATGGLCVMPGSHVYHDELLSYTAAHDKDYLQVPSPDINPLCRNPRFVTCHAGDLVLWDSRTVHCNTPALINGLAKGSPPASPVQRDLLRAVVYVCMTPASKASLEVLTHRRLAFAARQGTNHWPHEFDSSDGEMLERIVDAEQLAAALNGASKACRELVG